MPTNDYPTDTQIRDALAIGLEAVDRMANEILKMTSCFRKLRTVKNPRDALGPLVENNIWPTMNTLGDLLNGLDAAEGCEDTDTAFRFVRRIVKKIQAANQPHEASEPYTPVAETIWNGTAWVARQPEAVNKSEVPIELWCHYCGKSHIVNGMQIGHRCTNCKTDSLQSSKPSAVPAEASELVKDAAEQWFVAKPIPIRAFRYNVDARPDWFTNLVNTNVIVTHETHCEITTLEGVMRGNVGDYIVCGTKGEPYPVKPDIFEGKYKSQPTPAPPVETVKWEPFYLSARQKWILLSKGGATREQAEQAAADLHNVKVLQDARDKEKGYLDDIYGALHDRPKDSRDAYMPAQLADEVRDLKRQLSAQSKAVAAVDAIQKYLIVLRIEFKSDDTPKWIAKSAGQRFQHVESQACYTAAEAVLALAAQLEQTKGDA
jgi:hypothetical protein